MRGRGCRIAVNEKTAAPLIDDLGMGAHRARDGDASRNEPFRNRDSERLRTRLQIEREARSGELARQLPLAHQTPEAEARLGHIHLLFLAPQAVAAENMQLESRLLLAQQSQHCN